MSVSVEAVIKNSCRYTGEGPHWEESSQSLLYVDIGVGDVHRWSASTGQDEVRHLDDMVSLVIPAKSGGYVIGLGRKLVLMDWASGKITKEFGEVQQGMETRFNDGKCDTSGRLWAGTMGLETAPAVLPPGLGSLYSMEKDGSIRKHLDNLDISNGMAWSADNHVMYFIDSIPRKLYAFDFDIDAGTISNQRTAVDLSSQPMQTHGLPDGMCMDTNGNLWVACYAAGKVFCFDPTTGKELRAVEFPVKQTTSCCFGGPNYDELYVTCAKRMSDEEFKSNQPLAGSVFKVTGLGVKGTPPSIFG